LYAETSEEELAVQLQVADLDVTGAEGFDGVVVGGDVGDGDGVVVAGGVTGVPVEP
jgi:hypothetical protein